MYTHVALIYILVFHTGIRVSKALNYPTKSICMITIISLFTFNALFKKRKEKQRDIKIMCLICEYILNFFLTSTIDF